MVLFKRFAFLFLAAGLLLAACNLPLTRTGGEPPAEATPDLVQTALALYTLQAAETLAAAPVQQTPTLSAPLAASPTSPAVLQPSATAVPPSPTSTATQIPPTATNIPATATTAPTKTPISYAGPASRSGPSLTAHYLEAPPRLDGVLDDWNLERSAVTAVVFGDNQHDGAADLSASLMLGWDLENLYIGVRVKDDVYVQNTSGERIFRGDSLEILFDANVAGDFYWDKLNGDDFQLGISPGSPDPGVDPEAYLWYPAEQAGERAKVKVGTTATDDGYRMEVKIPWTVLSANPGKGKHYGFVFSVSDNDKPSANDQQSMVSNVPARLLTYPSTWGDLTLAGGPVSGSGDNSGSTPGGDIEAEYFSSQPSLDGQLNEWHGTAVSVKAVVYGADKWDSAADLSGLLYVGWDEDFLYLGVLVTDNRYVQNASGEELFKGDSLELLFDRDLRGDAGNHSLSSDDYQIGISPGNPAPGDNEEAYQWLPSTKAGSRSKVKIAALQGSEGLVVEVAIPWTILGVEPAKNQVYGFTFSLSDNDNSERNQQQSMVSTSAGRKLTDPTTWGDLVLVK